MVVAMLRRHVDFSRKSLGMVDAMLIFLENPSIKNQPSAWSTPCCDAMLIFLENLKYLEFLAPAKMPF